MERPAARQAGGRPAARQVVRRRLAALAIVVVVGGGGGAALLLGGGGSSERGLAKRFLTAWQRSDYGAMYAALSPTSRQGTPLRQFTRAYRDANATATLAHRGIAAGRPRAAGGGAFVADVTAQTRIFGTISGPVRLPVASGKRAGVVWSPELVFPGLRPGERLTRSTTLPPRAAILARDGTPLASGPARSSALGASVLPAVGRLGKPSASRRRKLHALGYPDRAAVGVSGIEGALETQLAGRPGGELDAGSRVVARARPLPAHAVRTTIDPGIQRAAVLALGNRLGGVVVLRPRNGQVLAVAGIGASELQPPGSTFKMVTLTGVLENHLATPRTQFPVQTATQIEGVRLENANAESCGGTLAESFARSCNSVFAPLGVKLGAKRLVEVAQRFGFNRSPGLPGAVTSTIPPKIPDALAVGSSAIGQYQVSASALQMAIVAATIANGGERPTPTYSPGSSPAFARATSPEVAHTVRQLMVGVVRRGTGTPAAIPGVSVAGKTGTAELTSVSSSDPNKPAKSDPKNTDAWFAAFAPAARPRIALAVVLVRAGAGKDTAAPAAHDVLLAGLKRF